MIDKNKKNMDELLDNDVYATKKELNDEARVRAENDMKIIDDFTILRRTSNNKFAEITDKIAEIDQGPLLEKINKLEASQNQSQVVIDELVENQTALSDKVEIVKTSIDQITNSVSKIEANQNTLSNQVDANTEAVQDMAGLITNIEVNQVVLSDKIAANKSKINGFEEEMTAVKGNVKSNQDRIDILEANFLKRIKQLEEEHKTLTSQLVEADKTIDEKNGLINEKEDEIKRLQEEIQANNDGNKINLRFAKPLEFEITEVISVKNFINTYLKELIISRMNLRYPETVWGKDYSISLNGLDYNDVMQGKNITATIFAMQDSKLTDKSSFEIIVTHNYNINQKADFIEEFLQTAIPKSLRNVPESAAPNYNVPSEIAQTKPLKLLLHSKEFKSLPFKIFAEMNAASYWTDFHRSWQFIKNGYVGTGQSTVGSGAIINSVKNLYNSNLGYYNNIFKLIEQRINDSGVPCTITKKWVKQSRGSDTLHTLGNLTFDVPKISLDTDDVAIVKSRHYYLMINFEVKLTNELKKFCRGVTLALSDNLELY